MIFAWTHTSSYENVSWCGGLKRLTNLDLTAEYMYFVNLTVDIWIHENGHLKQKGERICDKCRSTLA
jgi:hypothetical protein